jgi:hypothetical protein
MKTFAVVLTLLLVLLVASRYLLFFEKFDSEEVPTVAFPFKNLFDDNGKKLNVILIAAPFRNENHEKLYLSYKEKGLSFCGISSYLDFPNPIINPYEDKFHEEQRHDYVKMVSAWLHCFQKPEYIETFRHLPNMLMTEADLKDVKNVTLPVVEKEYDFLYCCLSDNDQCTPGWQSYNRNWDLAKKCLEVMCAAGLKGILVGRQNCEFSKTCTGIVKVVNFLPYHEFQTELQKCRFLFVPNISDASPRVITEAICYDIPVLVNRNILGGWHNVIPSVTGELFSNEVDLRLALEKLKTGKYHPRKWFMENRGKEISGEKLAEFLIASYPNLNNKEMKYATITI